MSRIKELSPLPGEGALDTLLRFLSNPKDVQKEFDRLKAIRDDVNKLVEAYGKAKDMDRLKSEATSLRNKAETELAKTREALKVERLEHDKLIAAARKSLKSREEKIEAAEKKFEETASEATAQLVAREDSVSKRESEVDSREAEAKSLLSDATSAKAEVDRRAAALREAASQAGAH